MENKKMRGAFVEKAHQEAKVEINNNLDIPAPGPGQVLVENQCASLNWADIMVVRGEYPGAVPTENVIPGAEIMGTVVALGQGVDDLEIGQRVAGVCYPVVGAFAEYSVIDRGRLLSMGASIPYKEATVAGGVGITAYQLLFASHDLKAGQTVFMHDMTGGVGLSVIQLAVDAGAKVIGTVNSEDKVAVALEYGASKVIVRDKEDFVEAALDFTNGQGVDLLIDPFGGEKLVRGIDMLGTLGKVINININNDDSKVSDLEEIMYKLYERSSSIQCFDVFHIAPAGSERWNKGSQYIEERLADGRLKALVAKEFEFEQVQEMMDTLIEGKINGKLLLKIKADVL